VELRPDGGKQTWSYDPTGALTGTAWLAGSTTLFSQTATLDAAGERTALTDSWGTSGFTYDQDGRLSTASYPDGSSEADQYDYAGNRTVITNTVGLSTTVTTNGYDPADELTESSAVLGGGSPVLSTYRYDGDGNQTGSMGPSGTITNTYDLRGDLTGVQGLATSVSYVYDGQGRPAAGV
jgi:YD repeat-containing protein